VRTKPEVLQNIRAGLKEKNAQPRQVYEQQLLANESSDRPRDHKQVRNMAQAMTAETGKRKKWGNVADDVQSVLSSVQTHPFAKEICVRKGMSPMIVCYTEQQVAVLKRFCASKTPSQRENVQALFSSSSDILCGDVFFADNTEMVFGSNDEKAMVGALRQVFPRVKHVFCARHLEENIG